MFAEVGWTTDGTSVLWLGRDWRQMTTWGLQGVRRCETGTCGRF